MAAARSGEVDLAEFKRWWLAGHEGTGRWAEALAELTMEDVLEEFEELELSGPSWDV
jgi:hypothetical protein